MIDDIKIDIYLKVYEICHLFFLIYESVIFSLHYKRANVSSNLLGSL